MTTSKEQDRKAPLRLARPGKLELKKTVETGQVRQSFSHGRTKTVTVEVKRKRTYAPGAGGRMTEVKIPSAAEEAARREASPEAIEAFEAEVARTEQHLTAEERAARLRALEQAKRDEDARREREAEERRRAEEEAARRRAEEAKQQEVEARQAEEVESEEAAEPAPAAAAPAPAATEAQAEVPPARRPETPVRVKEAPREGAEAAEAEERGGKQKKAGKSSLGRAALKAARGEARRRSGKITVAEALQEDEERMRSLTSIRRKREREKARDVQARQEGQKVIRDVVLPETITVQDLASRMAERGADVVKALMKMGVMVNINQPIDADTAELVVTEFGHRVKRVSEADVELGLARGPEQDVEGLPRPPVVTVMGHVDHGKTSLLDALRQTDVAAHEAGGITQHIGAYQVTLSSGDKITFVDTPGHEAFTEMRMRGATVTDLVILVVAADDGIMPQTVEAINHAKAAEVPIIVAINKIDRPDADPEKVKQALLNYDLVPEDLGGDILVVGVSALKKTNLDKLEEAILLQAELLELKSNADAPAQGAVIEAKLERGRGAVATVLVQRGTLRVGDVFVAGAEWGRVRALINDRGEQVTEAGPSVPVEVLGLSGAPVAGDEFIVVDSENRAREVAEFRQQKQRASVQALSARGTLEQMFSKIREGATRELPVVVKSDVHGSLEAITGSLQKLGTDEVRINVLHAAVGGINESDVTLARASDAIIIGFNVRANPQAREMARRDGVDIRYYSIIYEVIDDARDLLTGMLKPAVRENLLGYAEIREVFDLSKAGKVAGCMVTEGMVKRGAKVRLLRDDVVIHEGTLRTLRRFKDEVREVKEGYECGMAFENYQDIQVGDVVEAYEVEEVARAL
jgi:translation initiation factor IF-2